MLGNLASLRMEKTHSPVTNPCNPLAFEPLLVAQLSSVNNWKHTYVGWRIVG